CWLKENLNIGTMIDSTQNPSDNGIIEKYCYNDDSIKCSIYGGLYQWDEAMQYDTTEGAKGICPIGWHLPTRNEYLTLRTLVGYNGNKLKEIGQGTGRGVGTNATGFSSLLTGIFSQGYFSFLGSNTVYWTSTNYDVSGSYAFQLVGADTNIYGSPVYRIGGNCVRCINDSSVSALPIELTTFTISVNSNNVTLNWNTATEINCASFEIEKSIVNSNTWQKIASVQASGNSNSPKHYSYIDKNVNAGKYSYRLKVVDLDGSSKYSNIVNAEIVAPIKFEMGQNYPNPWNPTTTIRYQVPVNILVTIKVFDALGREVATLVNEPKPAGSYEIVFNGHNLASGIYYYQMKAGNFIDTKKITLIK
ncbi:MAG: FISUMP domain-containing protein, partial [Ignavibacteriaceae bacterium]|nr:FISUMP domain-containing protein [Ignavibacteriaceae bacterium]